MAADSEAIGLNDAAVGGCICCVAQPLDKIRCNSERTRSISQSLAVSSSSVIVTAGASQVPNRPACSSFAQIDVDVPK